MTVVTIQWYYAGSDGDGGSSNGHLGVVEVMVTIQW